jgi:VanZ family protein
MRASDAHRWLATPLFRLQSLSLSIVAILIVTTVPAEFREASGWQLDPEWLDFFQNIALFAPLGFALQRKHMLVVVGTALLLSIGIEMLQIWQAARFPSPWDVFSNVLGAVGGALVGRRCVIDPARIPVQRWAVVACSMLAASLLFFWQLPTQSSVIAGWDEDFHLILGNESTGDRPWRGTVARVSIWSRALPMDDLRNVWTMHAAGPESGLLYASSPARSMTGGAAFHLPQNIARQVTRHIAASGAFTVALEVRSDATMQTGPARIITLSRDTQARNFDLGQEQDHIAFRVRNAVSGPNGEDARAETKSVVKAGNAMRIVATYDGSHSRIYVNDREEARSNIAAASCAIRDLCDSDLPAAWALLGATVALLMLAIGRCWRRPAVIAGCMIASAGLLALHRILDFMPAGVNPPFWVPLCAPFFAFAVAIARVAEPDATTRG